ncbi:unnamed protein product [Phytomonas sp. EM1]|nr:unnamed protein product [Phytomonas sp. EM1]|eukprot:CCW61943.1 unnamed protein product [Phytomonas sp. isolate EM1]
MNTVTVRDALSTHEVTRSLLRRRSTSLAVEIDKSIECDYRCGRAKVFFYDYRVLAAKRTRTLLIERIMQTKGAHGRDIIFLVVFMGAAEASIETLSWINIDCGLQHRCSVVFCWAIEEVVQFLETLSSSSYSLVATLARDTMPTSSSAPLPLLIEALTQSPQILTRTDIVRASNRCKSVADLLLCSTETLVDIPGFGPKKTKKVCELFNTPFVAGMPLVTDIVPKPHLSESVQADTKMPDAVRQALERIRDIEDNEDEGLETEFQVKSLNGIGK